MTARAPTTLPTPHRPLPRTVAPVQAETLDSYLRRLALANRLDPAALRAHLAGDTRRRAPIPLEALAQVSGQRRHALRHALPELDATRLRPTSRGPRPAGVIRQHCIPCTRGRGHRDDVWCWRHDHEVICRRHLLWTGDGQPLTRGGAQLDLRGQPDVLAAHRRHHRLIRRHGWTATAAAFSTARYICGHWHSHGEHEQDFHRLMTRFQGADWRRVPANDATVHAASYPQIVALTRLLVSPFWRARAVQGWPEPTAFITELHRTVAPGYHWSLRRSAHGNFEPLVAAITDEHPHLRDEISWPTLVEGFDPFAPDIWDTRSSPTVPPIRRTPAQA